jgi:hypothetical protein
VVIRQAFEGADGLNYRVKTASIPGPLLAIRRGANLPYFGKKNVKYAHFPQEHKRRAFQGFPGRSKYQGGEKEPVKGFFSFRVLSLASQVY